VGTSFPGWPYQQSGGPWCWEWPSPSPAGRQRRTPRACRGGSGPRRIQEQPLECLIIHDDTMRSAPSPGQCQCLGLMTCWCYHASRVMPSQLWAPLTQAAGEGTSESIPDCCSFAKGTPAVDEVLSNDQDRPGEEAGGNNSAYGLRPVSRACAGWVQACAGGAAGAAWGRPARADAPGAGASAERAAREGGSARTVPADGGIRERRSLGQPSSLLGG
jgi:hypothetical protein